MARLPKNEGTQGDLKSFDKIPVMNEKRCERTRNPERFARKEEGIDTLLRDEGKIASSSSFGAQSFEMLRERILFILFFLGVSIECNDKNQNLFGHNYPVMSLIKHSHKPHNTHLKRGAHVLARNCRAEELPVSGEMR